MLFVSPSWIISTLRLALQAALGKVTELFFSHYLLMLSYLRINRLSLVLSTSNIKLLAHLQSDLIHNYTEEHSTEFNGIHLPVSRPKRGSHDNCPE